MSNNRRKMCLRAFRMLYGKMSIPRIIMHLPRLASKGYEINDDYASAAAEISKRLEAVLGPRLVEMAMGRWPDNA